MKNGVLLRFEGLKPSIFTVENIISKNYFNARVLTKAYFLFECIDFS